VHAQDLVKPPFARQPWATFRTFDLASQERAGWLDFVKPEAVIHLAALYGRVWGEVDMTKTAGINAGLTGQLARDCAARKARMMFMSSSEVYGASADRGTVFPSSSLLPLNMYGMSKKWGEEACKAYAPEGLQITRLNMPYGPAKWTILAGTVPQTSGKPGTVGYNVLHSMLWEAHHGFDLKVHKGTTRCLTWVGDTVRGLAMILESGKPGTWNVNRNDDHRPVSELAEMALTLTGRRSNLHEEDPPQGVTLRKSLDNTRLLALDWKPEVPLEEGVKLAYDYFRNFDKGGVWRGA
jgi:nucleoside-diphosphate-sugar epimerase